MGPHHSSGGAGDRALQRSFTSLGLRKPRAWGSLFLPRQGGMCQAPTPGLSRNNHLTPPALWEPAELGRGGIPWCKA